MLLRLVVLPNGVYMSYHVFSFGRAGWLESLTTVIFCVWVWDWQRVTQIGDCPQKSGTVTGNQGCLVSSNEWCWYEILMVFLNSWYATNSFISYFNLIFTRQLTKIHKPQFFFIFYFLNFMLCNRLTALSSTDTVLIFCSYWPHMLSEITSNILYSVQGRN